MSHSHHHHGHSHHHDHDLRQHDRKLLEWLIGINLFGMLVEVVGGYVTNSLALLSDAAHMFTHLFSLIVAYLAIRMAMRLQNHEMTFGYFRMEILAAFFNAITVFGIVLLIVAEAIEKLLHPSPVMVKEMFAIAVFGLVVNLVGAWILSRSKRADINLKAVLVHLLSDTFSSVAIIAGGIVMHYTGWTWVDPLASVLIAVVIALWGVDLLRISTKVLLQGVPRGIDPKSVIGAILEVPGVKDVHDVHIWELTTHKYVMTGHVLTENVRLSESKLLLDHINKLVEERFRIDHTTFQFECHGEDYCHGHEVCDGR